MGNCLSANGTGVEAAPSKQSQDGQAADGKTRNLLSQPSNDGSRSQGSLHSNLLRHQTKQDVFQKYETVKVLGNGSMGFVAKVKVKPDAFGGSAVAKKKKTNIFATAKPDNNAIQERRHVPVFYALKSIILDRVSPMFLQELRNEIDILKDMDHPNIVKAHEVYDYRKQIYIVLELCDGDDLYTRAPYTEKQSAIIMGKLLSAVKYMHDHGIVHRDLKFENIMFEDNSYDAEIKVIDFGLSKKFLAGQKDTMTEGVGTIYTMAPQVLQGVYTSQADLWSCGVIAYMLLTSHRPFYHRRRRQMIDLIMRAEYALEGTHWEGKSDESKDMVKNLLVLDPKKRMTAAQALKHVWLSKEFNLSDRKPHVSISSAVDANLLHYKNTSQLKKIALNVIAHRSSTAEILHLRQCFDQYDSTNDGVITFEEFQQALKDANYSPETLKEIFESIDVNKNGHIMYTEFLAATLEAHGHIAEERIAEAFDRLDSDDSGYISRKNLRDMLGKDATSQEIDDIISSGDEDGDGQLSYPEFLGMFRRKTTEMVQQVTTLQSAQSMDVGSDSLVGLDAKIPGGKFDSSVQDNQQGA